MKTDNFALIIALAKRGAIQNSIKISSAELAFDLKVSQQTASRWLIELETDDLIQRRFARVFLTAKARNLLEKAKEDIDSVFRNAKTHLRLKGRVVSGMHEGRFYLSIKEYKDQIKKSLGYDIFPGTLNLKLEGELNADGKRKLSGLRGIEIAGFRKNGRVLGGAKVFRGEIIGRRASSKGAAIIPYKSHYGAEILELISPDNLRKKLGLKNNDEVTALLDI